MRKCRAWRQNEEASLPRRGFSGFRRVRHNLEMGRGRLPPGTFFLTPASGRLEIKSRQFFGRFYRKRLLGEAGTNDTGAALERRSSSLKASEEKMKTFGMLLLMALSTSPALARQDDQNTSEVGGGMLREARSDIPARLESDDRMFTVQAGRSASQPRKATRVKNEKPLPKKVGAS
jgi:hypothetical protein